MKLSWLKFGTITAAAAALFGFLLKKRRKNAAGKDDGGQDSSPVIAAGIKANAAVFDGLYEGLFQAVRNRETLYTDAYEEWCGRAERLDDEEFRAAFAQRFSAEDTADEPLCRQKMEELLACIAQADILRERENGVSCAADEALCRAYLTTDGGRPEMSAEYTVLKSAWICGGRVTEYGMVMQSAGKCEGGTLS